MLVKEVVASNRKPYTPPIKLPVPEGTSFTLAKSTFVENTPRLKFHSRRRTKAQFITAVSTANILNQLNNQNPISNPKTHNIICYADIKKVPPSNYLGDTFLMFPLWQLVDIHG
jgi:hypothetical protein